MRACAQRGVEWRCAGCAAVLSGGASVALADRNSAAAGGSTSCQVGGTGGAYGVAGTYCEAGRARYTLDVGCEVPRVNVQLRQEMQLLPQRQALTARGATRVGRWRRRCSNVHCSACCCGTRRLAWQRWSSRGGGGRQLQLLKGAKGPAHPTVLSPQAGPGPRVGPEPCSPERLGRPGCLGPHGPPSVTWCAVSVPMPKRGLSTPAPAVQQRHLRLPEAERDWGRRLGTAAWVEVLRGEVPPLPVPTAQAQGTAQQVLACWPKPKTHAQVYAQQHHHGNLSSRNGSSSSSRPCPVARPSGTPPCILVSWRGHRGG